MRGRGPRFGPPRPRFGFDHDEFDEDFDKGAVAATDLSTSEEVQGDDFRAAEAEVADLAEHTHEEEHVGGHEEVLDGEHVALREEGEGETAVVDEHQAVTDSAESGWERVIVRPSSAERGGRDRRRG